MIWKKGLLNLSSLFLWVELSFVEGKFAFVIIL